MVLSQVGSWAPKCHAVQGAANFGRALSTMLQLSRPLYASVMRWLFWLQPLSALTPFTVMWPSLIFCWCWALMYIPRPKRRSWFQPTAAATTGSTLPQRNACASTWMWRSSTWRQLKAVDMRLKSLSKPMMKIWWSLQSEKEWPMPVWLVSWKPKPEKKEFIWHFPRWNERQVATSMRSFATWRTWRIGVTSVS